MKLSLTSKIFVAFVITLVTFASIGVFSVRAFHALGEDLRSINDGHLQLARLAGQLETHQENRFLTLNRVFDTTPDKREVLLNIATTVFPGVIGQRLGELEDVCNRQLARETVRNDAGRRTFYENVLKRVSTLEDKHEQVNELSRKMLVHVRTSTQVPALASAVEKLEFNLRGETYQLNKDIEEETDRAVRRAEQEERNAFWRVVLFTTAALLIGLLLTVVAARAVAPVHKLVAFARAISRGDYQQKLALRGDDELAALAEELTLMAKNRKEREEELDRQQHELEKAYHRVADLKRYHESVVQSLNTAVIVTDRDLNVTSTNRAVETRLGLERNKIRGRRLPDLDIGAALADELGDLTTFFTPTSRDDGAGASLRFASGLSLSERRFDVALAPFESERGEVLGLVLAAEDVTEAMRTKEALIRSERLAAIGRMSAHVTHEIRNPLSSIGLNAEMLETIGVGDEAAAEEAKTLSRAIIREVDRLTAITDEYLRFARLPQPELRNEDVAGMLRAIAEFVERDCAVAKVTLSVDRPEGPVELWVDPDQIRQALLNLVRNAKESMPEGGHIELAVEPGDDATALVVRDTGVGIAPEDVERIFDPFYSTKQTGTGLGLALVQQIVAEHGGRLEVGANDPRGTEFRLVIPSNQPSDIARLSAESVFTKKAADG